jgi:hypothetical protein
MEIGIFAINILKNLRFLRMGTGLATSLCKTKQPAAVWQPVVAY